MIMRRGECGYHILISIFKFSGYTIFDPSLFSPNNEYIRIFISIFLLFQISLK